MKDSLIHDLEPATVARYLMQVERAEQGEWSAHTVYRGHAKAHWRVEPELLRSPSPTVPDADEKCEGIPATLREDRMFDLFCRHLPVFRPDLLRCSGDTNAPALEWNIMALARHYGLPTRFIDFTTNPLVALFFAVEEEPKEDAVVCLVRVAHRHSVSEVGRVAVGGGPTDVRPVDLSYLMLSYVGEHVDRKPGWDTVRSRCDEIRRRYPHVKEQPSRKRLADAAFLPQYIDERIAAQGSLFMYELSFKKQRLEDALEERMAIQGIRIRASDKEPLRRQLNALGVNRCTLFPGLAGIAEHLRWWVYEKGNLD